MNKPNDIDKATARPWHAYNKTDGSFINDEIGKEICVVDTRYRPTIECHANAELIVRAVNERNALLECEKTLAVIFQNAEMMNAAEPNRVWSAIEKAAGQTLANLAAVRAREGK